MTRITQIAPYPTRHPRHGGQLRAHHIARALETAGHAVERISVFSSAHYQSVADEPTVDLMPALPNLRHPKVPQVADMTICELAATDPACFAAFAARMDAARPDVVLLEEPWLWPALRRWLATQTTPPQVVFDAHNIESKAKAAILADVQIDRASAIVAEVAALERDVVRAAAGLAATTDEDAAELRGWTDRPVVVARNGTVARRTAHLRGILPEQLDPQWRFVLFIGSAHPPNASGFLQLAMPALPVLRSTERIVVAGGVSRLLAPVIEAGGVNFLIRDRLVLLGQVSDLGLDCLLANTAGILLPITYGGGSNLKTAEALVSGLPIVGTPMAFRGFSDFADLPHVTIAETPDAFAAGVRRLLDSDGARSPVPEAGRLLWDATARPLVDLMTAIAGDYGEISVTGSSIAEKAPSPSFG